MLRQVIKVDNGQRLKKDVVLVPKAPTFDKGNYGATATKAVVRVAIKIVKEEVPSRFQDQEDRKNEGYITPQTGNEIMESVGV